MANRTMADAVRAILVKKAFVPGDPTAAAGAVPPGGDPLAAAGAAAAAGAVPPGGDPAAAGAVPPGGDPAAAGAVPPGGDPAMGGAPMDPMAGLAPMGPDAAMAGAMPQSGMINMTADEFTKFIKQMMAAFGQNAAPAQQAQPDIGAKLDTLIAVLQGQAKPAAQAAAPVVAGA